MFELQAVSFTYGTKQVLSQVNLQLDTTRFTLIKGPSGSGKSTLLRLLSRLIVPSSGEIFYRGQPLSEFEPTAYRRKVGYLQQIPVMLDASVKDNLLLPLRLKAAGGRIPPGDQELRRYLEDFLLTDLKLEDHAQKLSVGQKQRLAFIRGLLMEPEVLLLDEPTAALDEVSRHLVEQKAEELNRASGVGVVMISHNDYTPAAVVPRTIYLEAGQVREAVQ